METFVMPVQVRWSDLDPNFHLRHSVFYDWGALARIQFLYKYGLTDQVMQSLHFGPIIFREECIFRKEIRLGDDVTINLELVKARKDHSRWTVRHNIIKNKEILSAILTVDGAWIDTVQRKLATPPSKVVEVFELMPKPADFEWEVK
jgi:acyl-CoA thioester hydrolase